MDAAPFGGVFFLIVMFLMLFYSHVFFPGVPIKLDDAEGAPELQGRNVKVLASGDVEFLGLPYTMREFRAELRTRNQLGTLPGRILLEAELSADEGLKREVEDLLRGAGVNLKFPGTRLELPDDAGFPGARNPVLVVGINLNGQLFFQHQLIPETVLEERLTREVQRAGAGVTLLLQADKNVPAERIVELSRIARKAGVSELRIATKPART